MQLTIELPSTLVEKISQLPNSNRFIAQWLEIALLLTEQDHRSLDDLAKDISEKVKRRGLTEEELQTLLEDD